MVDLNIRDIIDNSTNEFINIINSIPKHTKQETFNFLGKTNTAVGIIQNALQVKDSIFIWKLEKFFLNFKQKYEDSVEKENIKSKFENNTKRLKKETNLVIMALNNIIAEEKLNI